MTARAARMPDQRDPADLIRDDDPDALRAAVHDPGLLTHAVIDTAARGANLGEVEGRVARAVAQQLRRLPPEAVMTATDHLQAIIGDGLMPGTVLAAVVDAYTPVKASTSSYDQLDVDPDEYDYDGPAMDL